MELTPLERLLYEVDPLGTAKDYTLTRVQLEALLESVETLREEVDAHDECEADCLCFERGWEKALEEAIEAVRRI